MYIMTLYLEDGGKRKTRRSTIRQGPQQEDEQNVQAIGYPDHFHPQKYLQEVLHESERKTGMLGAKGVVYS